MLSTEDLERLIAVKRREIETEKIVLGLSSPQRTECHLQDVEENTENVRTFRNRKQVNGHRVTDRDNAETEDKKERDDNTASYHPEEIPADLERYIRRYLGLPVMLKAGEFSPNNPLVRGERAPGDALRGLGEYERRRNTLRRIRQQQYREYLDQQAKKKQEEKEQAERKRREREEKERQEEEERDRLRRELEQERESAEQRRASVCYVQTSTVHTAPAVTTANNDYRNFSKVDTGVQVGSGKPLSVGVQTDDAELYRLSPSPSKGLTQAERELSPRTVGDDERPIQPAPWAETHRDQHRRRSYGDFDERLSVKKSNREKLVADLRHTYMPSIFDAEAIQRRNLQAQQEAAERRQFYQQELKNQIQEQQRIREERQTREKMLEQAEMRRLEEQLRMLRADQSHELRHHQHITAQMKENSSEFDKKRTALQKEIDLEHQKLLRATAQPVAAKRSTLTSRSDTTISQLPFYYPKNQKSPEKRPPFSTNIPDNSIFSPNYDVESYLRRNLNPSRESLMSNRIESVSERNYADIDNRSADYKNYEGDGDKKIVVEKALVHDRPRERRNVIEKPKYEPSCLKRDSEIPDDVTPIPVLRHTPKVANDNASEKLSASMKRVDVQKNILKTLPNNDGKNVNILTQLGSIRRQLQLEQMRLDSMVKSDKT